MNKLFLCALLLFSLKNYANEIDNDFDISIFFNIEDAPAPVDPLIPDNATLTEDFNAFFEQLQRSERISTPEMREKDKLTTMRRKLFFKSFRTEISLYLQEIKKPAPESSGKIFEHDLDELQRLERDKQIVALKRVQTSYMAAYQNYLTKNAIQVSHDQMLKEFNNFLVRYKIIRAPRKYKEPRVIDLT